MRSVKLKTVIICLVCLVSLFLLFSLTHSAAVVNKRAVDNQADSAKDNVMSRDKMRRSDDVVKGNKGIGNAARQSKETNLEKPVTRLGSVNAIGNNPVENQLKLPGQRSPASQQRNNGGAVGQHDLGNIPRPVAQGDTAHHRDEGKVSNEGEHLKDKDVYQPQENILPPAGGDSHGVGDFPHDNNNKEDLLQDSPDRGGRKSKNQGRLKFDSAHEGRTMGLIVPLPLDRLQPPDHVDGLRMEHDGHLNKDYKKEIFLGEHHHEFEAESDSKMTGRLKMIFHRADLNHDGSLVSSELKEWILLKVKEHLNEAVKENDRIFLHLDTDKDGFVTWKEFNLHFLLAKGLKQEQIEKHPDDFDALALDSVDKEKIIRYKFRWAEADEEPQDNRLTRDELKNFRHPEQSPALLQRMARDIIDNLDQDGDDIITEEEFISLPRGHHADLGAGGTSEEEGENSWQEERRKEFRNIIDLNGDGKITEQELKVYVDPHNANHAQLEADNLVQLADEDKNGRLSMQEVLDSAELFFGSKAVNAGGNFHDEF